MNNEMLEKYARLILKAGVNLQEGQNLRIAGEPIHWEFAALVEKTAYEMGARYVRIELDHPISAINRSRYQKDQFLGYVPSYLEKTIDSYVKEEWAMLHIGGEQDPEINAQIDQKRHSKNVKSLIEVRKPLMHSMSVTNRWCVCALPTPKWAMKVMGASTEQEAVQNFWKVLIPILKLDQPDPIKAWQDHSAALKRRSEFLNKSGADYFHFVGPSTDLKVYLNPKSIWVGGEMKTVDGNSFFPNLPTEEIFTTPNFKTTTGKVAVTCPVKVLGDRVNGAWFKFIDGQVVDFGAADVRGRELLTQYFEIDPKAKFLGEVALVDSSSPIFQSKKLFDSILYDENAACHIALGQGISMGIVGGDKMNEEELELSGSNKSLLHTDFMIGSDEIDVDLVDQSGKRVKVINRGKFVI